MFNKKLVISLVLGIVVFMSALLGFVIIPNSLNKFHAVALNIETSASVSGNGGAAVMVGEYLYFTHGFTSRSSIKYKQNDYNKIRGQGKGGIWRVKMANGTPEYNNDYLKYLDDWFGGEDPKSQYSRFDPLQQPYASSMDKVVKKGTLELIVPKIAGFEDTALWVFGNTLIYTSPNNEKNRNGQLQRNKTDFFAVNLNGSNHRRIYTTRTDNVAQSNYTVAWSGKPYLLIKDGNVLRRVDMKGKTKTISKKVESSNTSFVLPQVSGYFQGYDYENGRWVLADNTTNLKNSYSGLMGYVFYTEARTTKEGKEDAMLGNSVWAFNIATGKKVKIRQNYNTHALLALADGYLMVKTEIARPYAKTEVYAVGDITAINIERANDSRATFAPEYVTKGIEEEESIYLSVEKRTSKSLNFQYIILANKIGDRLSIYEPETKTSRTIPNTEDAEAIIAVNSGNIMYNDKEGNYVTIDWNGQPIGSVTIENRAGRITPFCLLDKNGRYGGGYMFFHVGYVEEVVDEDHDHEAAGNHSHDTMTIGMLESVKDGREYYLARLAKKYIYLPENKVENN
jgi:hypothetical protein